ncbi:hypothetical protein D3C87_1564170 [compost metagenome]
MSWGIGTIPLRSSEAIASWLISIPWTACPLATSSELTEPWPQPTSRMRAPTCKVGSIPAILPNALPSASIRESSR